MKAKRMAAVLLAAALTLPCWNLAAKAAFSDVPSNAWYAQDVAAAERSGILQGTGNGRFSPDGNLTLAQAITMAARTYAYERGETIPKTGGSTWYSDFLQYANDKGICAIGEFGAAYDNFCNRLTMAKLFARVVPESTATQRNDVTSLPDVQSASENQAVFTLYQLGILTGSDKYGTFHPYQYIKRSETAAILNRVLNPDTRKSFTLEKAPTLEQFRSPELAELYSRRYVDRMIDYHADIFRTLISLSILRAEDPDTLALQYVSPVITLLNVCDRQPEREAECLEKLDAHVRLFFRTFNIKRGEP